MLLITLSNSSAANYRYNKKVICCQPKTKEHVTIASGCQVSEACGGFYQVTPSADKFTITIALPVSLEVERNNL